MGARNRTLCYFPKRLVLTVKGFRLITPLLFSPLVLLVGYRCLEAVNLGLQNVFGSDLHYFLNSLFRRISFCILAENGGRNLGRVRRLCLDAALGSWKALISTSSHLPTVLLLPATGFFWSVFLRQTLNAASLFA